MMGSSNEQCSQEVLATSVSSVDKINLPLSIDDGSLTIGNDQNLPLDLVSKLVGDIIVACGVTLGIAPFMSIIDKSVVQRAAGTHTILQSSVESVTAITRNPVKFVKSPMFLMMWGVYAATYTTANCLKTIIEHRNSKEHVSKKSRQTLTSSSLDLGAFGTFALTTTVNSATSLIKDKFYARQFGTTASKMPLITYGLWGARDCMVIGSSFILPEYVSKSIQQQTDLDKKTSLQISQLTCPILAQLVATPAQMLGLDFYNRPLTDLSYKTAAIDRIKFLQMNFSSILGARIVRIAPSYGIGGIGNTHFRELWRDYVHDMDLNKNSSILKL